MITLGIIGVVAAMTLPSIITSYEKKETVARLKKMYMSIRNAIQMAEINNGPRQNWLFNDDDEAKEFYTTEILSNLKCAKIDKNSNCYFSDGSAIFLSVARYYGLVEVFFFPKTTKKYINGTAKGRSKRYRLYYSFYYYQPHETIQFKGDMINYNRDQLLNDGSFRCTGNDPRNCLYLIIYDGWQIKDDYPW